ALLSGHYEITDSVDLFAEVIASHSTVRFHAGLQIAGSSFGGTTLGASNPYNPFGQDVGVSFSYEGLPIITETSENLVRPLIGVRGAVFSGWHYEVVAYTSKDRLSIDAPSGIDPNSLQTAL